MARSIALSLVALLLIGGWCAAQPAGGALKPCLLAGRGSYIPVDFVSGVRGLDSAPSFPVDEVAMVPLGAAVRRAGGHAFLTWQYGRPVLEVQVLGQTAQYLALTPGGFWRHAAVRELIPVNRRQIIPEWPHVDTTFPHRPPFEVNWRRSYLDWRPDEAWIRAQQTPPPTPPPATARGRRIGLTWEVAR